MATTVLRMFAGVVQDVRVHVGGINVIREDRRYGDARRS
jgi:hypothetical protein